MDNFKVGDRVVCIDNTGCIFIKKFINYTITFSACNYVRVDDLTGDYYDNRFILLSEYRKIKLNKIFKNE